MWKTKKEFVRAWVKALRSGKYTQGFGQLRTPENEMCCLGVACDVWDSNGWAKDGGDWIYCIDGIMEKFGLPREVMKLLGVTHREIFIESLDSHLSYTNDSLKYNFEKIADLIEEEFLNA